MPLDDWERRRDLEGGKQVCIWLHETEDAELYVEDLTYRGGDFDVWVHHVDADEWEDLGTFDTVDAAIDRAVSWAGSNP
ncbi:hypothetical protein ACNS7O_13090 [Haloferacaceae archaeon DSL9]